MGFSQSTHLLICLSLEISTCTITYPGGLIDLVNSNDLTQMVNFPTQIPYCDSHSPAVLDLFLSSDANICSTMVFPTLGNSDHVVVSVSIGFLSSSKQMPHFIM